MFALFTAPYVCDSNNRCINPNRCPGNSTFQRCASSCRPTCSNPYPTSCSRECYIGCVCNDGYVLDYQNNCIRLSDCRYNGGNNGSSCNFIRYYLTL
uniref:TIL domain-containing protein n=1 Tax=Syphacia muris TaxID=451379 RepID=A0A0N5ATK2_9BILA